MSDLRDQIDEWINKISYIHTMDYHLVTRGNGVLIQAKTWMNPEKIMLNEGSW